MSEEQLPVDHLTGPWFKPAVEWADYVIRRQHGRHPPGSPCKVRRTEAGLELKFEDGDVVVLNGAEYYAIGAEGDNPNSRWFEPMIDYLSVKYGLEPGVINREFSKFCYMLQLNRGPIEGFKVGGRLITYEDKQDPESPVAQWALAINESPEQGLTMLSGILLRAASYLADVRVAENSFIDAANEKAVEEIKDATDREAEEG